MKKTLLLIAAFALSATATFAQKGKEFEGKVVYELSFPGLEIDANSAAMLPKESIVYIKKGRTRTEMSMGMGMSNVTITDSKAKTATVLYDMMGNKMAIKMTEADMKSSEPKSEPTVTLLNETKDIAGYKCKKAEIKTNDAENSVTTVYYTPEIGSKEMNWQQGAMKGIDGFPMEFETKQQGMTMKFVVKSVNKEEVPESKFTIPTDYKETSKEDLQKMFGG